MPLPRPRLDPSYSPEVVAPELSADRLDWMQGTSNARSAITPPIIDGLC